MSFSPDWLRRRLIDLGADKATRLVVALSGGLDSTVLLHTLSRLASGVPVSAIHVNHQLHADADRWQQHCEELCASLAIPLQAVTVAVATDCGAGPEAAARTARYAAFREQLRAGDVLLSAHHLDDQAETLLLHLMRSSGPLGLAGMPTERALGKARLLRPLLDVRRETLRQYADREELSWVEDPGNADTGLDRNYLRHDILPRLESRWPRSSQRLARSSELLSEASALLDALAAIDLADKDPARLPVDRLLALGDVRARNLLRYTARQLDLPVPPAKALQRIVNECLTAKEDAQPLVEWHGANARRYRNELFLLADPSAPPDGGQLKPGDSLDLGVLGRLHADADSPRGVSPKIAVDGFRVAFRDGGEALQPERDAHRRPLKKLLQEAGVLPWMRARIPLLYCGETLVAVGDLWLEQSVVTAPGIAIRWEDRPVIR